jgi:hypothetical protein
MFPVSIVYSDSKLISVIFFAVSSVVIPMQDPEFLVVML